MSLKLNSCCLRLIDLSIASDNQGFADCFIFLLDSFFTGTCLSDKVCRALTTFLILSLTSSLMSWLKSIFSRSFKNKCLSKWEKSRKYFVSWHRGTAGFLPCSKQVGDPLYQLTYSAFVIFCDTFDVINQRCSMVGYTSGFCNQWHVAQVKKHVKIIRCLVISIVI